MAIKIKRKYSDLIQAYGVESYPDECCGFLLGKESDGERHVLSTLPAPNATQREEQFHRFLIEPEAFLQAERFARERDLDVVGFYHSHPNADARPSEYDIEHAWPWYSYIIVSVRESGAEEMTSWRLRDDRSQFEEEELVFT